MKKHMLSILLCFALLISLFPAALAEDIELEPVPEPEMTEEPVGADTPGGPEDDIAIVDSEAISPTDEPNASSGTCGAHLTWTLNDAGTLTISGTGAMYNYDWDDTPWYSARNSVKKLVIESGATSVGKRAFAFCRNMTSATLPDGVTSIGQEAFSYCNNLTSVTVPNSVTSIGTSAFSSCTILESIAIPNGVTAIKADTFHYCKALKRVTIPSSVTSIGESAFSGCLSLTSLVIPDSVTTIDGFAFCNCKNVVSLTIGSGVKTIGKYAFISCRSLKSVTIPAGVTSVGEAAFASCDNLTSIRFNGPAPKLSARCFEDVTATAYYPKNEASWTEQKRQSYSGDLTWVAYVIGPSLRVRGQSTAGLALGWDAIDGAEAYRVQSKNGSGSWLSLKILKSTQFTDDTARMGESCSYRAQVYVDGKWSEYGDTLEVFFNPFADVSGTKTIEYVAWAFNNGIVNGTGSTKFSPDNPCTRIQFVMMLWKMHGSPDVGGKNPFSDISGTKTTKAILWALDQGIINSGKKFDPDGNISRIQIVMMLWKLAGSPDVGGKNPFTDVSGRKTTRAVLWAYQNGITKGTSATKFSPDKDCTRVQLVIFLYKYNNIYHVI